MKKEKVLIPFNGYLVVLILLLSIAITLYGFITNSMILAAASLLVSVLLIKGFIVIGPNSSKVLLLFGDYKGSIKQSGLFWVNPFTIKRVCLYVQETLKAKKLRLMIKWEILF